MGNRAFDLSQLLQRGYPVVPGFVVPAIAFWEFIEVLGESEPILADLPHSSFHVDVDNPHQLQQVAQQIRQAITKATLPPLWASSLLAAAEVVQAATMILHPSPSLPSKKLRFSQQLKVEGSNLSSSLPLGFSSGVQPSNIDHLGILESHICPKQPDALIICLKRVWAELFRARSLFYWQRNGVNLQQLNLAVLVQPIWNAIASGTIEANPTEWNIQATWGIGTALTKGEVLPDSYQLQPQTGTVQTQLLGSKTLAYRLNNDSVSVSEAGRDSAQAGRDSAQAVATLGASAGRERAQAALPEPSYTPAMSGLQAYLLNEEQQNQYALEETYLKQLIELSQQLTTEFGSTFSLEWTLCQTPGSLEPKLYLTQFSPRFRAVSTQRLMSTQPPTSNIIPQLVRGLPAAAGRVTAPAQVILGVNPALETVFPGRILIAQSITPDRLPLLRQAAGIVTEQGGMTSHAAIIARELGIPAVVGAIGVTQLIQTGESLMIDGDRGEIHRLGTGARELETGESPITNPQLTIPNYQYPIATQLLINLSQVNSLEKTVGLPVDGVGLLRSELMILDALENLHYDEWLRQGLKSELVARLVQLIIQFAAAFAPRPVFYRSLDWREAEFANYASHEFQFLSGSVSPPQGEVSPISSLRGTRRYMSDPASFDLELAALEQVYAYGYTNVQLILPFVRSLEEFTFCRRRVEQAGLTENPHFQLWIMAEVPSVLFLLPDYVKAGVQGISIGTNDLTQLLLATDRDQGELGSTLDGRHPAVMRALKQLIQTARSTGIPCSICGQAPALYPEIIDSLVEWGITSISVDVNDVERTYKAIARAEQRLLLQAARQKINN